MSCRRWQELIEQSIHEPLAAEAEKHLDEHLQGCPGCRELHSELGALKDLIDQHGHREPHPARLEHVWTRLEPELDRVDAASSDRQVTGTAPTMSRPIWWHLARLLPAAAALLLVGFGAGWWLGGSGPAPLGQSAATDPSLASLPVEVSADPGATIQEAGSSIDADLRDYLESTRPLLLAIVNRETAGSLDEALDLSVERRAAQRLATAAGPLVERLGEERRRRERDLVSELQLVLLQLANLEEREQAAALKMIQQMLANRSLLIQVELTEARAGRRSRT
jgi:hypothetical protein